MTASLHASAAAWGVSRAYVAANGAHMQVPDATLRQFLELLGANPDGNSAIPQQTEHALFASPESVDTCFVPSFLHRDRVWGLTCQLYGLRSARNWGIGDFEDLARLAGIVGAAGCDFLGVHPLHALYPAVPERCSPYSPSSRRFLNVLYIAPDIEPEFARIAPPPLDALRHSDLVDYADVARTKFTALEAMFEVFQSQAPQDRRNDFEAYRSRVGEALEHHCLFETLHAHHHGRVRHRRHRELAAARQQRLARPVTVDAAERRRYPDGAADVRAHLERGEPGRERSGAAPAASSRSAA